jgi:hypothetical protein
MPEPSPDPINEYIEWCKSNGDPIRDENIEKLKNGRHFAIIYRDDNGEFVSRGFGVKPEIDIETRMNLLRVLAPEKYATIGLQAMGIDVPEGLSREELLALIDKKIEEYTTIVEEAEAGQVKKVATEKRRRSKQLKPAESELAELHRQRAELDAKIAAQQTKIKKICDD